jgi:hypothetical protein
VSKEPTSVPELNLADALQRGIGLRLDRRFAGVHRRIYFALALLIMALTAMGIALWSELRNLKADLARAGVEADAIKEEVAIQKARLGRLDEKLDDRVPKTVPDTHEAADQTAHVGKLNEKLDKNLGETARAIQGVADQRAHLNRLAEKLDENLAKTERAVQEAVVRIESKLPITRPEPTPSFAPMTLSDEEREIIRKFFEVRKKQDANRFDTKVGEIAPDTAPLYPVPSLLYNDVPKLKDHRFFADEGAGTIILVRPLDNRVVAIV